MFVRTFLILSLVGIFVLLVLARACRSDQAITKRITAA